MNNRNYRPIWHCYRDIDMQHFCNHGYILKVSSSKTDLKNAFFVNFMYVTICDLHGHRSWCEMKDYI